MGIHTVSYDDFNKLNSGWYACILLYQVWARTLARACASAKARSKIAVYTHVSVSLTTVQLEKFVPKI